MNLTGLDLIKFRSAPILAVVLLVGCQSTSPRVSEVSHRTIVYTINAEDEAVFVHDRASHVSITPQPLPPAERREEFRVRWTPATITAVKFQYRQVSLPNEIREQTFAATGKRTTRFRVQGDDFIKGGAVSAWRVSLWSDAKSCVAEQRSATW